MNCNKKEISIQLLQRSNQKSKHSKKMLNKEI